LPFPAFPWNWYVVLEVYSWSLKEMNIIRFRVKLPRRLGEIRIFFSIWFSPKTFCVKKIATMDLLQIWNGSKMEIKMHYEFCQLFWRVRCWVVDWCGKCPAFIIIEFFWRAYFLILIWSIWVMKAVLEDSIKSSQITKIFHARFTRGIFSS
jgi:hypothetical protein